MRIGNQKKNQNTLVRFFAESPFRWYDYVIFAVLLAVCFLCFQQTDLLHTAGCSYGYLNGHFWDFYDYLAAEGIQDGVVGLHAGYLPSVYLVFAVWNLPVRLFSWGAVPTNAISYIPAMWAKILPCLAFLFSGIVVYEIAKGFSMGERKAKICMYAYLTVPMAIFGQFIMGQYESLPVLLLLLGVWMWQKKKTFWFVFWFALAVSFKVTVLFAFFPLLFLREKRISRILLCSLGVFLLYAGEYLFYSHSDAFHQYVFGVGSLADSPASYLFSADLFTGFFLNPEKPMVVYLTVLLLCLTFAYAYFVHPKTEKEEGQYATYLCSLAFAVFFAFSKFHPQWLLLAIPFWTISSFQHTNTKIFLVLELVFMGVYVAFASQVFVRILDETLLNGGLLKLFMENGAVSPYQTMGEYFSFLSPSLLLTILTALLLIFGIFKHPHFLAEDPSAGADSTLPWIRGRFVFGLLLFLLPALGCFFYSVREPASSYRETAIEERLLLAENRTVTQSFTAGKETVEKLKFPVSLGENGNDGSVTVAIEKDGEILYTERFNCGDCYEGEILVLRPDVTLFPGEDYAVTFSAEIAEDSTFALLLGSANPNLSPCRTENEEWKKHITMTIYR